MPRNARHEFSQLERIALRGNVHEQDEEFLGRLREIAPTKKQFLEKSMQPNYKLSAIGTTRDAFQYPEGAFPETTRRVRRKSHLEQQMRNQLRLSMKQRSPRQGKSPRPGEDPQFDLTNDQASGQKSARWRKLSEHFLKSSAASLQDDASQRRRDSGDDAGSDDVELDEEEKEKRRKRRQKGFMLQAQSHTQEQEVKEEEKPRTLFEVWTRLRALQAIGIKFSRLETSGQFLIRALTMLLSPLTRKQRTKVEAALHTYLVDAMQGTESVHNSQRYLFEGETPLSRALVKHTLLFFDKRVGIGINTEAGYTGRLSTSLADEEAAAVEAAAAAAAASTENDLAFVGGPRKQRFPRGQEGRQEFGGHGSTMGVRPAVAGAVSLSRRGSSATASASAFGGSQYLGSSAASSSGADLQNLWNKTEASLQGHMLPEGEKFEYRPLQVAYTALLNSISNPPPIDITAKMQGRSAAPPEIQELLLGFFVEVSAREEQPSSDEEEHEDRSATALAVAGSPGGTTSPTTHPVTEPLDAHAPSEHSGFGLSRIEETLASKKKFRIPKKLTQAHITSVPWRVEPRVGIIRVNQLDTKTKKHILDKAGEEAYKALDVFLPTGVVEGVVDKKTFAHKRTEEAREALRAAGGAAKAELADEEAFASPRDGADRKYHNAAERCLSKVRSTMQGTITDKKIVRVMNLKRFEMQDFRLLLEPAKKTLARLLILQNHGVLSGAFWNVRLPKQVFIALMEKGRICDASTGKQAFELIRSHVATKRRCISSDFLSKTAATARMPCAVLEYEKEKRRLAELQALNTTSAFAPARGSGRNEGSKGSSGSKGGAASKEAAILGQSYAVGADRLESFLRNPDPLYQTVSFVRKKPPAAGEEDEEEEEDKDKTPADEAAGGDHTEAVAETPTTIDGRGSTLTQGDPSSPTKGGALGRATDGAHNKQQMMTYTIAGNAKVDLAWALGLLKAPAGQPISSAAELANADEERQARPKFKENEPVTDVSLEDVLVCLADQDSILAGVGSTTAANKEVGAPPGGTAVATDGNAGSGDPGAGNNSPSLAAGATSPGAGGSKASVSVDVDPRNASKASNFSAASTTGGAYQGGGAQAEGEGGSKGGLEALRQLRRRILEKFECTVDAFQNMAFLVVGKDDGGDVADADGAGASSGKVAKKTWIHLPLVDVHRIMCRIVGDVVSLTLVQELFALIDGPICSTGKISLRELLIALAVVSPHLQLEYLRAKMLALHGSLEKGLIDLLDPKDTIGLIRKRYADVVTNKHASKGYARRPNKSVTKRSSLEGRMGASSAAKSSVGGAAGSSMAVVQGVCPPTGDEPEPEYYDENTTSGALHFRKLVDTYANTDLSGDPVFCKFANEMVYAPLHRAPSTILNDSMSETATTLDLPSLSPGVVLESGRQTPQLGSALGDISSPVFFDSSMRTPAQPRREWMDTPGGSFIGHPGFRQGKKWSDLFFMPVHTSDCTRALNSRLDREQEEVCLRENFRYMHESFSGPRSTGADEVDDVLENFVLTLGFFVDRLAQMSLANRYESYRCFHASNIIGRPFLRLAELQTALQAACGNPLFDTFRGKVSSHFPLLCKAFCASSANRDGRCSGADFESLMESLSASQLDATNIFRSFVQSEFGTLHVWSFINIAVGAMCPSLVLDEFMSNDMLVAALKVFASYHHKPFTFDEWLCLCQSCGIRDKRAAQLCFLFLDVDNSELVFAREILMAFQVKRQVASDGSISAAGKLMAAGTATGSKGKKGQAAEARRQREAEAQARKRARVVAVGDNFSNQFAATFASCDLLKRVISLPWQSNESEAVAGGFKTLKKLTHKTSAAAGGEGSTSGSARGGGSSSSGAAQAGAGKSSNGAKGEAAQGDSAGTGDEDSTTTGGSTTSSGDGATRVKLGFRKRRKLFPESQPVIHPELKAKESYLRKVDSCPAELLRADVIFNLETYAQAKNALQSHHTKLITDCGQRDMLELYFLRNKL
ncbi:unnamed protein product [Amoebophrya sp. A25]|nr:unnamed protein product [Amoebophrya sp. A25]|eukprot:GSA25T00017601001.1